MMLILSNACYQLLEGLMDQPHEYTKILIAEDNPDDELLTLRALRQLNGPTGIQIAPNGAIAIRCVDLDADPNVSSRLPSLIFLDLKLPLLSGAQVLKHIRSIGTFNLVPVVMLSGSDEMAGIQHCKDLGATGYLQKPVSIQQYLELVTSSARSVLNGLEPPSSPFVMFFDRTSADPGRRGDHGA